MEKIKVNLSYNTYNLLIHDMESFAFEIKNNLPNKNLFYNTVCKGMYYILKKESEDLRERLHSILNNNIPDGMINDILTSIEDLYSLHEHKDEWIKIIGFGEKSVNNILSAIENSKHCTLASFISSAGIPLIGVSVSKELVKHIDSWKDFRQKIDKGYDFTVIDGFDYV